VGPVHFQTADLPAGSLVGANYAKVPLQPSNPPETP
jgi:hypothetical protein